MNRKKNFKVFAAAVICFAAAITGYGQEKTQAKEIEGKITKVTVFPYQALIEKTAKISLKAGNNDIVLTGNSQFMIANSLQFQADNNVMVTDFTPAMIYVANTADESKFSAESKRKIKTLRDSIEDLNYVQATTRNSIAELQKEKTALDNMKPISNSQAVDTVQKIKDAITYYRQKVTEVNDLLQQQNKELSKRQEKITDLQSQLNLILQGEKENNQKTKSEYVINMNIYAEKACEVTFLYNYHVGNVAWTPLYDVKFSDPKSPVKFVLKGQLSQQTGEDWKDITLVFSSEQPNTQAALGELYPYYLYSNAPVRKTLSRDKKVKEVGDTDFMIVEDNISEYDSFDITQLYSVESNATNAVQRYTSHTVTATTMLGKEYEVGTKHTILSDGKTKTIPLETKTSMAAYKHYVIPKLAKTVFLSARIASWESLELMSSESRIYLDNRYINDGYLTSENTEDTLTLSIGQDKRVTTERKVVRTKPEKTNVFGSTLENNVEVTLTIRNGNQYPVSLNVQDQIPVSQFKDVKVTAVETAKATYDDKTGKLTWDLNVEQGQSLTIKFIYNVRYPKDMKLILN
ncbi:MAG: mucoidy inhibitor MuiA family protein [Bacteroidales bacterium]|jgi:uncharacterized protein (TIGR02231 family)|nr:mucoidy inhibitor MuiA family protein [Bacteroidales bacterium]